MSDLVLVLILLSGVGGVLNVVRMLSDGKTAAERVGFLVAACVAALYVWVLWSLGVKP
jgi:hypothetical protein